MRAAWALPAGRGLRGQGDPGSERHVWEQGVARDSKDLGDGAARPQFWRGSRYGRPG